jgi:hypothetical protein
MRTNGRTQHRTPAHRRPSRAQRHGRTRPRGQRRFHQRRRSRRRFCRFHLGRRRWGLDPRLFLLFDNRYAAALLGRAVTVRCETLANLLGNILFDRTRV